MQPQATSSQDALSQLQTQEGSTQNPNDILASQRQQLGVNAAQDTVTGLRGAINNTTKLLQQVAPSVMGRTGNSLVTDAQANRVIQNEQAPLQQNLSDEGTKYNDANTDLGNLQTQAEQAASGIYQGQQDKQSYLQNLYNTLYQKEQDAATRSQQDAAQQEAIREFNATPHGTGGTGNLDLSSLFGGGTASGPTLRVPGDPSKGFAFTDSAGNQANALQYSQANQIPFRTLLQQLADKGDTGAKAGLTFIGQDGNADPTKVTTPALANLYHSLTGRYVGVV